MTPRSRRLAFYLVCYGLSLVFALGALMLNTRTVPLNESIQSTKRVLKRLEQDNQELYLKYLSETRLEVVERTALKDLGMRPARRIRYLEVESR